MGKAIYSQFLLCLNRVMRNRLMQLMTPWYVPKCPDADIAPAWSLPSSPRRWSLFLNWVQKMVKAVPYLSSSYINPNSMSGLSSSHSSIKAGRTSHTCERAYARRRPGRDSFDRGPRDRLPHVTRPHPPDAETKGL